MYEFEPRYQNAPKSENCTNYMYVAIFYHVYYQNVELNNLLKKYHTGTINKIPIQTKQCKA